MQLFSKLNLEEVLDRQIFRGIYKLTLLRLRTLRLRQRERLCLSRPQLFDRSPHPFLDFFRLHHPRWEKSWPIFWSEYRKK